MLPGAVDLRTFGAVTKKIGMCKQRPSKERSKLKQEMAWQ
jgi:hypothetical protein